MEQAIPRFVGLWAAFGYVGQRAGEIEPMPIDASQICFSVLVWDSADQRGSKGRNLMDSIHNVTLCGATGIVRNGMLKDTLRYETIWARGV